MDQHDLDAIGVNASPEPRFEAVLTRRGLLRGLMAAPALAGAGIAPASAASGSTLRFKEIAHGPQKDHAVAEGYSARVLILWGDPVLPGAPAFDPRKQTAAAEAMQFGTNNDYQAFMPLPMGSQSSDHGLLWLNHEYPQSNMMFPGLGEKGSAAKVCAEQVGVEIQAIGGSVVEIRREAGDWKVVMGPNKRTALGRFKHEAAECALAADGRVVVYSGDDQRNEYLHRFVSRDRVNLADRAVNRDILDHGIASVARFNDNGTVDWMPLVFGEGPFTAANGFNSQADVVIDIRRAADLVRATPMDRPEDVEANHANGRVYMVLTNNSARRADNVDAVNSRPNNTTRQIVEMIPPTVDGKSDYAAASFKWEVFLMAGNPAEPAHKAKYGGELSASGWLACPDNVAFDKMGRMWIASDQGEAQQRFGIGDGIWACDTEGAGRAVTRMFYRTSTGAEICGPAFAPDRGGAAAAGRRVWCARVLPVWAGGRGAGAAGGWAGGGFRAGGRAGAGFGRRI